MSKQQSKPENLQKYIANAGICSRRRAEKLIREKRVRINRKVATVTSRVHPEDIVTVDGNRVDQMTVHIYLMLHKPVGYVSTHARFSGEKNIYSLVKSDVRLFSIGRLDKNSSGLMILTTDGELTQQLSHPKFEHEKEYEIVTKNEITPEHIHQLKAGVDIADGDGVVTAKQATKVDAHTMRIIITQGKKRQIRRMCAAVHLGIDSLKRIRIGKLLLDRLPVGHSRELTKKELKLLKKT